jgi:hypothetical protein
MITYEQARHKAKQFKSLTSLDVVAFDLLHAHFKQRVEAYLAHFTLEGKPRQRQATTKKDSVFQSTQDMLLFSLTYLKNNPLQEYHAFQFGLTQPQANEWIHRTLNWLWQTLAHLKELPARSDQALLEVLAKEVEVLLDGTERPIQRSTDYQTQKEHFSGKKSAYGQKQYPFDSSIEDSIPE